MINIVIFDHMLSLSLSLSVSLSLSLSLSLSIGICTFIVFIFFHTYYCLLLMWKSNSLFPIYTYEIVSLHILHTSRGCRRRCSGLGTGRVWSVRTGCMN